MDVGCDRTVPVDHGHDAKLSFLIPDRRRNPWIRDGLLVPFFPIPLTASDSKGDLQRPQLIRTAKRGEEATDDLVVSSHDLGPQPAQFFLPLPDFFVVVRPVDLCEAELVEEVQVGRLIVVGPSAEEVGRFGELEMVKVRELDGGEIDVEVVLLPAAELPCLLEDLSQLLGVVGNGGIPAEPELANPASTFVFNCSSSDENAILGIEEGYEVGWTSDGDGFPEEREEEGPDSFGDEEEGGGGNDRGRRKPAVGILVLVRVEDVGEDLGEDVVGYERDGHSRENEWWEDDGGGWGSKNERSRFSTPFCSNRRVPSLRLNIILSSGRHDIQGFQFELYVSGNHIS